MIVLGATAFYGKNEPCQELEFPLQSVAQSSYHKIDL